MKLTGKVWLHRKLKKNPVWTQLSPAVLKLFLHLITEANWKSESWYDGTEQIQVPVGSFITSYREMATDTKLSLQQVRDAAAHLARLDIAAFSSVKAPGRTHEKTLVKVVHFLEHQCPFGEEKAKTAEIDHAGEHANASEEVKEHKRLAAIAGISGTREGTHEAVREGTREEHAKISEQRNSQPISLKNGDTQRLFERPLKEEEVNKGRSEYKNTGSTVVFSIPEWKRDTTFQPFVEAFLQSGASAIDSDFQEAHRWVWKRLDPDQKQQRISAIQQRVLLGCDPRYIHRPRKFIESEWQRKIIAPAKNGSGSKFTDDVAEVYGERIARGEKPW